MGSIELFEPTLTPPLILQSLVKVICITDGIGAILRIDPKDFYHYKPHVFETLWIDTKVYTAERMY